jgi:RNA polymerase sigma factor (sigma-70 family)
MDPSQHGDEADLFSSYHDELVRKVGRALRGVSPATIEDACSTAWAQFLRHQPERDQNWRAWLVRVAWREALLLHRRERRLDQAGLDSVPELMDPRPSPQLQRLELNEALDVVAQVPERRRRLAILRLMGLSYDEIGKVTGLSYTRVNRLLAEANAHMRADLEQRNGTHDKRPRVARLQELEREPPRWLVRVIGRPPGAVRTTTLLAWRRAAIALDDYRQHLGGVAPSRGLGPRPKPLELGRAYDRALAAIAGLRRARAIEHGHGLDR